MIHTWFHPSTSGDIRVETSDGGCTLTVIDPTPREQESVRKVLAKAVEKAWIDSFGPVSTVGATVIAIRAAVHDVGAVLADANAFAPKGRITAIRSQGDQIFVTEETERALELGKAPEAEAAVTVHRPTPCCPYTRTGPDRRASDVLRTFTTKRQQQDWERDGVLFCVGGTTGHRYRLAHRHSPTAIRQGRIAADLTDGFVLHFHDSFRPPAEEVLAAKLVLEHREPWLRNASTCLSDRATDVFDNPIGHPTLDGRPDAALLSGIGGAVVGGVLGRAATSL